jgi:hypothetical protein
MSFSEILLTQAARGRKIPLDGDCLEWVKRLIDSGHLTTEFIPSEEASELRVLITDKGRALLNSLDE